MSIVKYQKVGDIRKAVNYILQDSKTEYNLVSTFGCDRFSVLEDFNSIYNLRKEKLNRKTNNKARMIFHSYSPDEKVTPEQVHNLSKELADEFLDNKHQYIIATHIDRDHIHSHIIFNEVRLDNLQMFDTKKKHMIDDLREINYEISLKYDLQILDEDRAKFDKNYLIDELDKVKNKDIESNITFKEVIKHEKIKKRSITHREYITRAKKDSYLGRFENDIDNSIINSNTFDEFINNMKNKGYEYKEGKYISFKYKNRSKFTRTKILGMHYNEESIRYRIKHKDFVIKKPIFKLNKEWINKNELSNKPGLIYWSSKKNIDYLTELSSRVYKENKSAEEIIKDDTKIKEDFVNKSREIFKLDNVVSFLKDKEKAFEVYKDSYNLIKVFKSLDSSEKKDLYKKLNYNKFKQYDKAKKDILVLKNTYKVNNVEDLKSLIEKIKIQRRELYIEINSKMNEIER